MSKLGWPAVDRQIVMKSLSQDIVFLGYYMEGDQILHYVSICSRGLLLLGASFTLRSADSSAEDCGYMRVRKRGAREVYNNNATHETYLAP